MLPAFIKNMKLPPWRGSVAVLASALLAMTLGNFYTVGNLSPYVASYMRIHVDPNANGTELVWMTGLFMLGLGTLGWLGGIMVEKIGCRLTSLIGSVFYCGFFVISTWTVSYSFVAFACTFGYFSWVGASILWVAAVTQGIKWFPNQTGLATSIINCGYGIGGVILNLVGTAYLNPNNRQPDLLVDHEWYFTDAAFLEKIPKYFWIITCILVGLNIIALPFMFEAPKAISEVHDNKAVSVSVESIDIASENRKVKSFDLTPATEPEPESEILLEITPKGMFKYKEFYLIWWTFAFLMLPVNFVVTYYKTFGLTFIHDDKYLTIVGGVGVFCTCVGKIFWGVIVEKKSYKYVMIAYSILFAIILQALMAAQYLYGVHSKAYFLIFVMLNYAMVGGNFTLLPTVVAVAFGTKNAGTNYGIYYSAQSVGSFAGAYVCQKLVDELKWKMSFTCIAAFGILAAITTLFMPVDLRSIRRPPKETIKIPPPIETDLTLVARL